MITLIKWPHYKQHHDLRPMYFFESMLEDHVFPSLQNTTIVCQVTVWKCQIASCIIHGHSSFLSWTNRLRVITCECIFNSMHDGDCLDDSNVRYVAPFSMIVWFGWHFCVFRDEIRVPISSFSSRVYTKDVGGSQFPSRPRFASFFFNCPCWKLDKSSYFSHTHTNPSISHLCWHRGCSGKTFLCERQVGSFIWTVRIFVTESPCLLIIRKSTRTGWNVARNVSW